VASPIAAPFAGAAVAGAALRNRLNNPAVANAIKIERIPISFFDTWAAPRRSAEAGGAYAWKQSRCALASDPKQRIIGALGKNDKPMVEAMRLRRLMKEGRQNHAPCHRGVLFEAKPGHPARPCPA
jgi:hypothetical protein